MTALFFGAALSASAACGGCGAKKDGEKKCDKSAKCTKKMEAMFKKFDKDGDGKLCLVEFKALAAACKKCAKNCKCENKSNCKDCKNGCKCEKQTKKKVAPAVKAAPAPKPAPAPKKAGGT